MSRDLVPQPERSLRGIGDLLGSTKLIPRDEKRVEEVQVKDLEFSIEDFAGGHGPQLEVLQVARTSRRILLMMARQAAKSWTLAGAYADRMVLRPGVTNLFLGLTGVAVYENFWTKVWKPLLLRYGLGPASGTKLNETRMTTEFRNGSRLIMSGTDDMSHVATFLGNRFAGSLVAIDESQQQRSGILRQLLRDVLPPMMSPTSTLVLSGVIPEVPAGPWWEESLKSTWQQFSWGRVRVDAEPQNETSREWEDNGKTVWITAVNVHTPESPVVLIQHMQDNNLTLADPQIQRDWLAVRAFDLEATAYRYNVTRNGYHREEPEWLAKFLAKYAGDPYFGHFHRTVQPKDGSARYGIMAAKPWPGIEIFSAGIDPGATDRFSFNVIGWGTETDKIQHVFEFSSKRGANLSWSHIEPLRRLVEHELTPSWWYYDASGSKVVLDTFVGDTGLPALMPANKAGGLYGGVKRVGDLQLRALLQTMIGSAAEEDYQKSRWDPDARARLQWKWASQWHPDSSESKRYALGGYFNLYETPPDEKSLEQEDREKHERNMRRRSAARTGNVLEEDLDEAYEQDDNEEDDNAIDDE